MSELWRIKVYDGKGRFHADDAADTEDDAIRQAQGWTGQLGQRKWTAWVYGPDGQERRFQKGREVNP